MSEPRSPYGKYNGNEYEYVMRALDTETEGSKSFSWVQHFEEVFAKKVGALYAVAVNSGTSGLHAALFSAGVSHGHEVIQPGMTVVMDAYATIHCGGYQFLPTLFLRRSILIQMKLFVR